MCRRFVRWFRTTKTTDWSIASVFHWTWLLPKIARTNTPKTDWIRSRTLDWCVRMKSVLWFVHWSADRTWAALRKIRREACDSKCTKIPRICWRKRCLSHAPVSGRESLSKSCPAIRAIDANSGKSRTQSTRPRRSPCESHSVVCIQIAVFCDSARTDIYW